MTTLTNAAILLAARQHDVTCGGCRMLARPARVLGIAERVKLEHETAQLVVEYAIVEYRCRTPDCEVGAGPGVACEVPL